MRSPTRALAPALTAALLLAACGDPPATTPRTGPPPVTLTAPATPTTPATSTNPPPPTTTPAAPGLPADVPTTGPNLTRAGETPPLMPPEATAHTPAGAVAFAEFFIRTIDWGYATVSSTYMRHYFQTTCVACVSIADAIDSAAAKHHRFIGDRFLIKSGTASESHTGDHAIVTVGFDVTSGEVVDELGAFVDGAPALRRSVRLTLTWMAPGWSVENWGPVL